MSYPVVFLLSLLAGFGCVAGVRALAQRVGFLDQADGRRKVQAAPVALGGGLALLLALVAALSISYLLFPDVQGAVEHNWLRLVAVGFASLTIAAVGLLDDLIDLRARHKLFGQFLAVAILIGLGGYRIETLGFLGFQIPLGPLSLLLTAFWFLGTINAVNLLDGMDGLLGTVGLIAFAAIAWMAFTVGNPLAGWMALIVVGVLCGFLVFNLPPASIYLGDCGSLLIGLLLATLSIDASLKGPTTAIVAPAVLLVLPIMDTSAAIIRRKLTGRGLASSDRGHLHHELQRQGLNRLRVLLLVGTLAVIAASGALITTFLQNDLFAFIAGGSVIMILLASGLFGVAEFRLIRQRLFGLIRSATGRDAVEVSVRLQGQVDWGQAWHDLLNEAESLRLITAVLDVNDPSRQEAYHARWDRSADTEHFWRLETVLRAHDNLIGKLTVLGEGSTPSVDHLQWLGRVQTVLEALATRPEPSPPVARLDLEHPATAAQPATAASPA